jgi:hypothetical protein
MGSVKLVVGEADVEGEIIGIGEGSLPEKPHHVELITGHYHTSVDLCRKHDFQLVDRSSNKRHDFSIVQIQI